jgi:hypothetical protein
MYILLKTYKMSVVKINMPDFKKVKQNVDKMWTRVPIVAGNKAAFFFKDNCRREAWVEDGKVQKWQRRKLGTRRNKGRRLLVDPGGLLRSIHLASPRDVLHKLLACSLIQKHDKGILNVFALKFN